MAVATPPGSAIIEVIIPIIICAMLGLFIYFIPTFIANKKQHLQKTSILILNIFLGWTFIGWVVALIWATLQEKKSNIDKIE